MPALPQTNQDGRVPVLLRAASRTKEIVAVFACEPGSGPDQMVAYGLGRWFEVDLRWLTLSRPLTQDEAPRGVTVKAALARDGLPLLDVRPRVTQEMHEVRYSRWHRLAKRLAS